ncbi:MAG: PQQ-binding-like beta-propeller repeat protein [Acidobacteria bacterium]|nr:PQQ-binding-like beta-propeller repeat protein [Acidobacteriota bacterium]
MVGVVGLTPVGSWAQPDPAALYKKSCAQCHEDPQARAPDWAAMKQMTVQAILDSLVSGKMAENAQPLSAEEKRAIAQFLGAADTPGATRATTNACPSAPLADPTRGPRWSGWGLDPENSRFQKDAGLTATDVPKLKLKWAFGFPDSTSAYSQPAVAAGRVFVGSDKGVVYALDAKTGCTYWSFKAPAGVRTAISVGPAGDGKQAVYFGDLAANVHAIDADTGKPIWIRRLDTHQAARITGAPVLQGGRIYATVSSWEEGSGGRAGYECCTFRGSIAALDAATGVIVWQTYTIEGKPRPQRKTPSGTQLWGPAGAAVWMAPTIDQKRGVLYVGTGNAYSAPEAGTSDAILAVDLKTGAIRWSRQLTPNDIFVIGCRDKNPNCPDEVGPDFDFGSSPILRTIPGGKSVLVVGQKSGVAYGLDPDRSGAILWQFRAGQGGALGGIEWGMAADEENVYIPVSDLLQPQDAPRGLFALRLATGEKVWHAPHPALSCKGGRGCIGAQSAAITVIPGAVFAGSIDGHLRAYSTRDGQVVWQFDTAREFDTVNGVKATGGSIDAAGPVVAAGLVLTNSGYGQWRGKPGNVLLAFEVAK